MKILKVTLITLSVTIITFIALGQMTNNKTSSSPENTKYVYCEIWERYTTGIGDSRYDNVYLNFGDVSTYPNQSEENDKVKTYKDSMDALNFMSAKGWDFVSRYVRSIDNGVEYVCLLRKKIK